MKFYSDGRHRARRWQCWLIQTSGRLRGLLDIECVVQDKAYLTRFRCSNKTEVSRAMTLWTKEEGTMSSLDRETRIGDVFLDIGANIGIYSLAAGHRVGPNGRVIAVEPHKVYVVSLMHNVLANRFEDRIQVLSAPLAEKPAIAELQYRRFDAASTGSQYGAPIEGVDFEPVVSEVCNGTSLDELFSSGAFPSPNLIKIDVDGIELRILKGMQKMLTSKMRPRSVQVEINVGENDTIVAFMKACGYALVQRHLTKQGKKLSGEGKDMAAIAHNAVFEPVAEGSGP